MVLAPALIASWQYCFALTGNAKHSIAAIIMKKLVVFMITSIHVFYCGILVSSAWSPFFKPSPLTDCSRE